MAQQIRAADVYLKIQKAYDLIQTQYQYWVGYAHNDGMGLHYAPRFAFLFQPFHQAIVSCKDLERIYPQKQEYLSSLIVLMEEIISNLHDNVQRTYTIGEQLGTGTQMAGYLSYARNKAEELRIKAVQLPQLPAAAAVQQFQHLKCAYNHWLQFVDVNQFTCCRQGCGTIYYHVQEQVRACLQCNYYVCDNCINHQQL
ncbi:hypothetical protein pb186bvf_013934 [Paramecium bursaria]